MKRNATITGAGARIDECAGFIQDAYQAKKYGVQRLLVEKPGAIGMHVTINNATSTGGTILRALAGLNVIGRLELTTVGNDLEVKVVGEAWPILDRILVFLFGLFIFLWPVSITALVGAFRQNVFLDQVFRDALGWLASNNT